MTSQTLSPQIGRQIILQLEEPKRESAIALDGFKSWDPWDRQRLTFFLEALAVRGFVARETPSQVVRTPGAWRSTPLGRESMTRGDFLAEGDARS
jgi:hypothetical protein